MARDTWRLIAWTSIARIYWVVANLLTAVITARLLGPSGRGVLVAATSWVTMFSTFGFLSLSQVVIFMAAGRKPEEWLPRVLGGLVRILSIVAVLGLAVAAALYAYDGARIFNNIPPFTLLIAFCAFPFLLWIENGYGLLMALGNLRLLNGAQVIGGTIALLLTFLAAGPLHLGVAGAVSAWVVAQAAIVAITFGYVFRRARYLPLRDNVTRELLSGGAKLHLNAIGTYLFTQANILILNHYRSPKETAYFQLAVQIFSGIQIIPMAVSTVAYSLVSKHGPDRAWPQQRRLLMEVLVLTIAVGAATYLVAPWVVPFVFGAAFRPAVPIVRIVVLSVVGSTMSMVMASQWISRGLFLQAALVTLFLGALTVLANYLVVPRFGMYGAAWVTAGTYGFSVIANGAMAIWVNARASHAVAAQ
jgi:O-antigen/teichoic acid export membrane protein